MSTEPGELKRRLRIANYLIQCSKIFAIAVVLLGISVLAGWHFNIEFLKRLKPLSIAMNPFTAICFICCGWALWILNKGSSDRHKRKVYCLAAFVLIAGIIELLASLFQWQPGFDQILYKDKLNKDILIAGAKNKMPPNTALNFILASLCFFLIDRKGKKFMRTYEILVVSIAMIALLALYGYIYEINYLYGMARYVPMAFNTAIGFLILAMGIIFSRPFTGMTVILIEHGSGEKVFLQLIAFVIPLLVGWFQIEGVRKGYFTQGFATAVFVIIVYILQVIFLVRDVLLDHNLHKEEEKTATIIRENAKQLSLILYNLGEGVIVTDEKGTVIASNPAAEEMLGIGPTDGTISSWRQYYTLYHPDEETPLTMEENPLQRALKGIPSDDVEIFVRNPSHPSGKELLVTGRPIRDEEGKIKAGIVVFRDISNRRKLERMLQENEKQLRTIIANIGEGVIVADKNGKFLLFNKKAEEILSIGPVEGGFEQWQQSYGVFYPDGVTPFPGSEMPLAKAVEGIAISNVEMLVRNHIFPKGKSILVSGQPIKDEKGNVTAGVVDFQDITEKKRLEQSLDEIQKKYKELINSKQC